MIALQRKQQTALAVTGHNMACTSFMQLYSWAQGTTTGSALPAAPTWPTVTAAHHSVTKDSALFGSSGSTDVLFALRWACMPCMPRLQQETLPAAVVQLLLPDTI
jgi:hypothetical protein